MVEEAVRLTGREIFLRLIPEDPSLLAYSPGQFFMAGLPGYGEAPFSISSPPQDRGGFDLCIRAAGSLTNRIHRLKKGDILWVRGPFGRGFDIEGLKGKDILFIAGGIGIVPMRSLIKSVLEGSGFGRLTLIYGSKAPDDILFREELDEWGKKGLDVRLTIDAPHPGWGGATGLVTAVIPKVEVREGRTASVVIGPPVMYRFVILGLNDRGMRPEDILLSLERRMKCGLGKCGHCQINSLYVCQEGPVFRLSELKGMPEAL